ncbi:MAG: hypothetical protein AAF467_12880 [Actinomycetota bacterium]
MVGAFGDAHTGRWSGAAYVYRRSDEDWAGQKLVASDAARSDYFGWAVDVDASTVVVSARGDDDHGVGSGAVYVFEPAADGSWAEHKLTASNAASGDSFGDAVAIDGGTIAVGAPFAIIDDRQVGTAYTYTRGLDGGWDEQELGSRTLRNHTTYGYAVDVDGDVVAVGAPGVVHGPDWVGSVFRHGPAVGRLCDGLPVTVDLNLGDTPTDRADVILGTPGSDLIAALGGDDVVCAGGGADLVLGGDGADVIRGGPGDDVLMGGYGADVLSGGSENDRIHGGFGDDLAWGGSGSDTATGGPGDDVVAGGSESDVRLEGNGGDDIVTGNGGSEMVDGGWGDDEVRGGPGDDLVFGGAVGDDFVAGNDGTDVCDGGWADLARGDVAAVNCESVLRVP